MTEEKLATVLKAMDAVFQGALETLEKGPQKDVEDRGVGRYDSDYMTVSTVKIREGKQPYETAIQHIQYTPPGEWVTVEAYSDIKSAALGHTKWLKTMMTLPLPDELVDCGNSEFSFGEKYPRKDI